MAYLSHHAMVIVIVGVNGAGGTPFSPLLTTWMSEHWKLGAQARGFDADKRPCWTIGIHRYLPLWAESSILMLGSSEKTHPHPMLESPAEPSSTEQCQMSRSRTGVVGHPTLNSVNWHCVLSFLMSPPPYAPPMWSIPNRTQGLGKGTNLPAQLALCFLLELTPTTLQLACRLYKFMQDAWLNGRSHLLVSSFRARTDENRCRAWEKNNCIFCFDSRSAGGMLTCSPLLNISVASFFHFPLLCCCR